MGLPSLKKKMKILVCTVSKAGKISEGTDSFDVMINPASLNVGHSICYSESSAIGMIEDEPKFTNSPPDTLNFDLVIDGTGVVNLPIPGLGSPDVKTQIKELKKIVYDYDGDKHSPNVVKLIWGTFLFLGQMKSMKVDYTLFKLAGDPLRAKVTLSFGGFMTTEEQIKKMEKTSPDMTHYIEFKASDTLPALCQKIYGDGGWYPEVARINKLVSFRHIPAGTHLLFPPLR